MQMKKRKKPSYLAPWLHIVALENLVKVVI